MIIFFISIALKELSVLDERSIKEICKYAVDHSPRHYTAYQKCLIKQAIDAARSWEELLEQ